MTPQGLTPLQKHIWRLLSGRPMTRGDLRRAIPTASCNEMTAALANISPLLRREGMHYAIREPSGLDQRLAEFDREIAAAARRGDRAEWDRLRAARRDAVRAEREGA